MSNHMDPHGDYEDAYDRWHNGQIFCYLQATAGLDGNDPYEGTFAEWVRDCAEPAAPELQDFIDAANESIIESRWENVAEVRGGRI